MSGLGIIGMVAGAAAGIATAAVQAKSAATMGRREARTQLYIAQLEADHIRELKVRWQKLAIGVIPVAAGAAVFAAIALTQGAGARK